MWSSIPKSSMPRRAEVKELAEMALEHAKLSVQLRIFDLPQRPDKSALECAQELVKVLHILETGDGTEDQARYLDIGGLEVTDGETYAWQGERQFSAIIRWSEKKWKKHPDPELLANRLDSVKQALEEKGWDVDWLNCSFSDRRLHGRFLFEPRATRKELLFPSAEYLAEDLKDFLAKQTFHGLHNGKEHHISSFEVKGWRARYYQQQLDRGLPTTIEVKVAKPVIRELLDKILKDRDIELDGGRCTFAPLRCLSAFDPRTLVADVRFESGASLDSMRILTGMYNQRRPGSEATFKCDEHNSNNDWLAIIPTTFELAAYLRKHGPGKWEPLVQVNDHGGFPLRKWEYLQKTYGSPEHKFDIERMQTDIRTLRSALDADERARSRGKTKGLITPEKNKYLSRLVDINRQRELDLYELITTYEAPLVHGEDERDTIAMMRSLSEEQLNAWKNEMLRRSDRVFARFAEEWRRLQNLNQAG